MKKSLLATCAAALVLVLSACSQQPRTLDVSGTVINQLGSGVGGMSVAVGDKSTTTTADGRFSFEGLDVPYDLVVYSADTGHVFEGLNTANPVVLPIETILNPGTTSVTVTGTLTTAVPAGHVAKVCVEGINVQVSGCDNLAAGDTTYNVNAAWSEGGTIDVRVHALFIAEDADGLPTGYDEYGTATGAISEGGTPNIDVTMAAGPSATTISGSVSLPAGFDLDNVSGGVRLSDDYVLPIFESVTSAVPSTFSVAMPELGPGSYTLLASASPATGSKVAVGWLHDVAPASSATIDIPSAPTFVTPADGATGVTTETEFTISGVGAGATTFLFSGPEAIAITTTDTTVTIPDLSEYGLPLAAATPYTAGAYHVPGYDANSAAYGWIGDYFEAYLGVTSGGSGGDEDAAISASSISVTTE